MRASTGTRLLAASAGPVGRRPACGAWFSSSLSVLDTDSPPDARQGPLGARQCGTPVRPSRSLAASAHQASAGRWTAAGNHAPIVECAVADQQHAYHRYQADPSVPPSQPAALVLRVDDAEAWIHRARFGRRDFGGSGRGLSLVAHRRSSVAGVQESRGAGVGTGERWGRRAAGCRRPWRGWVGGDGGGWRSGGEWHAAQPIQPKQELACPGPAGGQVRA
jgi:hypothetical protein